MLQFKQRNLGYFNRKRLSRDIDNWTASEVLVKLLCIKGSTHHDKPKVRSQSTQTLQMNQQKVGLYTALMNLQSQTNSLIMPGTETTFRILRHTKPHCFHQRLHAIVESIFSPVCQIRTEPALDPKHVQQTFEENVPVNGIERSRQIKERHQCTFTLVEMSSVDALILEIFFSKKMTKSSADKGPSFTTSFSRHSTLPITFQACCVFLISLILCFQSQHVFHSRSQPSAVASSSQVRCPGTSPLKANQYSPVALYNRGSGV